MPSIYERFRFNFVLSINSLGLSNLLKPRANSEKTKDSQPTSHKPSTNLDQNGLTKENLKKLSDNQKNNKQIKPSTNPVGFKVQKLESKNLNKENKGEGR